MKNRYVSARLVVFLLAAVLLLASCGGGASAATMHLVRTKGTVGVSDGEGKDLEPMDDLGLYSGYGVDTQAESYAWINLDDVKLTKMDADSEVEITKEGKKLTIDVKSGSLFFNVTEPLSDDESMDIRTSSMIVGIRGTCGWVTQDTAALLEGMVTVTAEGESVTVSAGEMAVLTEEGTLEVEPLTAASVPAFVQEEIADDEDLTANIQDDTDIGSVGSDLRALYQSLYDRYVAYGHPGFEVQYTEFIDFAQDGKPELLLFGPRMQNEKNPSVLLSFDIWLFGDEDAVKDSGPGMCNDAVADINGNREYFLALAESEGKLFLKLEKYDSLGGGTAGVDYEVTYWGFDDEDGWYEERAEHWLGGRCTFYSSGFENGDYYQEKEGGSEEEFAAFQAQYREVRSLLHISIDGTVTISEP